jgi:hypothetical protein
MFRTDEYVNFKNELSQYKKQLSNRPQVITSQADNRWRFGTLDLELSTHENYNRESKGRITVVIACYFLCVFLLLLLLSILSKHYGSRWLFFRSTVEV